MPELPEVETIKNDLRQRCPGTRILQIVVYDDRVLGNCQPARFIRFLKNKTIKDIFRRGKAIIMAFQGEGYLVVQLMMTGQLICSPEALKKRRDKETKVAFLLSNNERLIYNDHRLFGRLTVATDLTAISYLNRIGPEPLSRFFTPHWLKSGLSRKQSPIKSLLMNQYFVAGIGNIYASEILFHAGISPLRSANNLSDKEIRTLHTMTVKVLRLAVKYRGTSMNTYRDANGQKGNFMNWIKVYHREGKKCFVCHRPIEKIVLAGRSTFYCPECQA